MDTLGRVYELLQARHMTLYQLEKLSALPHSTLRSTRRRGGELRVETIERICLALGITLSEFFAEQSEAATREARSGGRAQVEERATDRKPMYRRTGGKHENGDY